MKYQGQVLRRYTGRAVWGTEKQGGERPINQGSRRTAFWASERSANNLLIMMGILQLSCVPLACVLIDLPTIASYHSCQSNPK